MSATFTVTQNDVITLAARRLGILELGGTLDSATQAEGVMLLNLLLKQLATNGLKIWTITDYVLPLTTNKKDYTIGPSALYDLNAAKLDNLPILTPTQATNAIAAITGAAPNP